MARDRMSAREYYGILALLALILVAQAGLCSRQTATERRVAELESKPCIMTGAHTGCERIGAR